MPAPLSVDFRRRILAGAKTESASKTAARFGLSLSTVHRLHRLRRLHGSVEAKPHRGGRGPALTDDDRARFDAYLAENPSMPHAAMARRFEADTGHALRRQTVQRMLARWRITRKKSP